MTLGRALLLRHVAASAVLFAGLWGCADTTREPAPVADILAAQGAGQAALLQDRLEDARAEYERLVEMAPDDPSGYLGLGLVALRAGDLDEAERRLEAARDRAEPDPSLDLALARVPWERGDTDEAREILEAAVARDSTHAPTLWALSELDRETARPGSAERLARLGRLLAIEPANLAARLARAEALLAAGRPDDAVAELETLLQQAPDFPASERARFDRAIDLARAGDAGAADDTLARFRAYFEVTGAYQAGLDAIRPPRGEVVGIPEFLFPFMQGQLRVVDQEEVLAALRFSDASELAGLSTLEGVPGPATLDAGDLDGDGDEDLFWSVAGEPRPLRVDLGRFVREDAPGGGPAAAAVAVVDVDDDRRLDVWLAGPTPRLLRRTADDGFEPIPFESGAGERSPRAVLFADLDQDGDLDGFEVGPGLDRFFRNNGDLTFSERAQQAGLAGPADADGWDATFGDLDLDLDLDLVVADGAGGVRVLENQRAGRFVTRTIEGAGDARIVRLADMDHDGAEDLLVAGPEGVRMAPGTAGPAFGPFRPIAPGAPAARDLLVFDFDNDGHLDLAVAGDGGAGPGLALFRGDGAGGFADAATYLPDVPGTVTRVLSLDYNEDGDADLALLGADGRPRLLRNDGGNANHHLRLGLVGLGEGSRKNNRFGIGARVEIRAGDLYQVRTVRDPTVLVGLDGRLKADVIRIGWPNGVPQDLYFPGTDQDIVEQQTLKGSCPLLYVWNGEGYEFVGDIMWKSALGMPLGILGGDRERPYAPAYPSREYRRLPAGILAAQGDAYAMKVTEELWETIYVDGLELVAVDHPDSIDVYVDERFVPPAPTPLELWRVGRRHAPVRAADGEGRNQLDLLAARDFAYVSNFSPGRFQGIAEPHELVLDLGDAARDGDAVLFLTGWVFPTDASINVAMSQSDAVAPAFPSLDVIGPDGEWQVAIADLGIPSGKDKTVVADLAGLFPTADRRVRIRTNLMVYWDEAFFTVGGPRPEPDEVRVTRVRATSADLAYRGFSREFRRGGRYGPHWFDHDSVTTAPRWADLAGRYTAYGDVTDLVAEGDDRYVIANAGDAITLRFDVDAFPELEPGWTRTFLVYSDGWVKDGDLNTATGDRVAPLPFRAQTEYPHGPGETYPDDPGARGFLESLDRQVPPGR